MQNVKNAERQGKKRFEREVVNSLKEAGFYDAKRIPLSGLQEGFKGDIKLRRNESSKELLANAKVEAVVLSLYMTQKSRMVLIFSLLNRIESRF